MEVQLKGVLGEDLFTACRDGDHDKALSLSSSTASPKSQHGRPLSAMMAVAADGDHADIVKSCLSEGGYVDDTVMLHILTSRAIKTHRILLTSKAVDPDFFVPWHGDILGSAASHGHVEWVRLCLEHGANPNLNKVDEFKSILGAAAESGSVEIVALLLNYDAWVQGSGAIVLAAEAGKIDVVDYLLDHGADVDEVGMEDDTDERETEKMGSALHKAAGKGNYSVMKLLLKRGAKVSLKDGQGKTPLDVARLAEQDEVIQILETYQPVSPIVPKLMQRSLIMRAFISNSFISKFIFQELYVYFCCVGCQSSLSAWPRLRLRVECFWPP